jgi:hypothetical protein
VEIDELTAKHNQGIEGIPVRFGRPDEMIYLGL